jgi:thiamine-monophosphate kinase
VVVGETTKSLSRRGAKVGQSIYVTGKVGPGNLEASAKLFGHKKILRPLINKFRLKLPLRIKEAELIKQYASCCIDSSDGLLSALNTIAEINNVGYRIENVPYAKNALLACKILSKPSSLLFIGECGEYELVFTLKPENEEKFLTEAERQNLGFNKIGNISEASTKILNTKEGIIDFRMFDIRARDYKSVSDYLSDIIEFADQH